MARKGYTLEEMVERCDRWGITRATSNSYLNEVSQRMMKEME